MKLFYSLWFFFFSLLANGQKLVKGLVLNDAGQPLVNAAVFINNSCAEATTDIHGNFELKVPAGRSALIVASEDYQSFSSIINPKGLPEQLTVKMQRKVSQKIHYERHLSAEWVNFFSSYFIGSSANATHCKIKNANALHFYLSQDEKELDVTTDKPLTIENKALGYTIKYYLESFVFNLQTGMFNYKGYCVYQPMKGSIARQKAWETNRSEAYYGSLMHFMRSVYRNQIVEEGFEVRPLKKIKSLPSYQTIKADTMQRSTTGKDSTQALSLFNEDDDYRDQVTNEDNYRNVIGSTITGDSIAYRISETTAGVDFSNFLMVTYRKKEPPVEYEQQMNGTSMTSQLVLINRRPVEIEWNGTYYDAGDLLVLGYWTWAQNLANSLPYDYTPPNAF
jgi:hypothetical protein